MARLIGFDEVNRGAVFVNPERVLAVRPATHGTEIWYGGDDSVFVWQSLDAVVFKIWGAE